MLTLIGLKDELYNTINVFNRANALACKKAKIF
jgi:hypothetical protein